MHYEVLVRTSYDENHVFCKLSDSQCYKLTVECRLGSKYVMFLKIIVTRARSGQVLTVFQVPLHIKKQINVIQLESPRRIENKVFDASFTDAHRKCVSRGSV